MGNSLEPIEPVIYRQTAIYNKSLVNKTYNLRPTTNIQLRHSKRYYNFIYRQKEIVTMVHIVVTKIYIYTILWQTIDLSAEL